MINMRIKWVSLFWKEWKMIGSPIYEYLESNKSELHTRQLQNARQSRLKQELYSFFLLHSMKLLACCTMSITLFILLPSCTPHVSTDRSLTMFIWGFVCVCVNHVCWSKIYWTKKPTNRRNMSHKSWILCVFFKVFVRGSSMLLCVMCQWSMLSVCGVCAWTCEDELPPCFVCRNILI